MEWLAEAGHECRILTTARFESAVTFTIAEHLTSLGVGLASRATARSRGKGRAGGRAGDCPVVKYAVGTVPVTLLLTRHNDELRPDRTEAAQYLRLVDRVLDDFEPDQ